MTDPAIIEAAARAMGDILNDFEDDPKLYRMLARAALAVVAPLIEAAALERAAKVAEEWIDCNFDGAAEAITDNIRALSKNEAK